MIRYLNKKLGQSTLEYAVLIVVIIGALLAINVYVKRGVQGRLKSSADDIGDQFSPNNTNALRVTKKISNTYETSNAGGSFTNIEHEYTNTTSNSVLLNTAAENWG